MQFVLFLAVAFVVLFLSIQLRRRYELAQQLKAMGLSAGLLQVIAVIALLLAAFQTITIIEAGTVGVVKVFGKVNDTPLTEGINVRNPFAEVIKMNIRTQQRQERMDVLEMEGLTVGLEVSVIYRLDGNQAPEVIRTIGRENAYITNILTPYFRSAVRGVAAQFRAEALYAAEGRQIVAQSIAELLNDATSPRGIIIEATPLRDVALPAKVMAAIEDKQQAKQESERMQYILEKEAKEAERKGIEAKGIRDFNKTVAEGISDNFLRWKGIEATQSLASSNNAKVVVIGSGKDGLPIILGGQ